MRDFKLLLTVNGVVTVLEFSTREAADEAFDEFPTDYAERAGVAWHLAKLYKSEEPGT